MSLVRTVYVRDLLPIMAVRCQMNWRLVDYFGTCKGEKTRSKKPCSSFMGNYECKWFQADFDPRYKGENVKNNHKVRTIRYSVCKEEKAND